MRSSRLLMVLLGILAAGPAVAATLDRVGEEGTFRIGHRVDAAPFSFVNEAGEATGYAVELCELIALDVAAATGVDQLQVQYVPVTTEDRFQAVVDGRIDILCGATTATLSRREQVAFSLPIFVTGVSALLRADAPTSLRELLAGQPPPTRQMMLQALTGQRFGVRAGTRSETWLRSAVDELAAGAEIVTVGDHHAGLEAVRGSTIDAYFADRALLQALLARSGQPEDLIIARRYFTYEPYALALARGDEDFRLLVDRTLSRIHRSSALGPLFAMYFGPLDEAMLALFLINSLPE